MTLQFFTILCLAFLIVAILMVIKSFVFKKKIQIVNPEQFIYETNEAKNSKNKILVVFNNGYWEIKEEVVSKEWSAEAGAQTFVDFDLEINDSRYKQLMNSDLNRDKFGEHSLKVIKEVELFNTFIPEDALRLKY